MARRKKIKVEKLNFTEEELARARAKADQEFKLIKEKFMKKPTKETKKPTKPTKKVKKGK